MLKHCFHDLEIIYRILFVFFDVKFWPFRGHKLPINIRKWQNLPQETFCFLHCKQTKKKKLKVSAELLFLNYYQE